MRNITDTITDVQGRRVEIGWDCDLVTVGEYRFPLPLFGAVLAAQDRAVAEAAVWVQENPDSEEDEEAALAAHETSDDSDPYEVF